MHRAPSRRRPLILAVLIALALVVGAPLMLSAAGADAGLDPLQVAIANQANCRLLLAKATTSAQQTRARQCIGDQGVVITAMSATPSPSATGTPSPSPTATVPPTTPPATTPPATTPPATTPPPTTTPPATTPPPSPTPTVCSTFAACGFPTAATTGVPAGTVLTPLVTDPQFGMVITTAGTVIDGKDITGWLDVRAANVTIKNSRIVSPYWWGIKANDSHATGLQVLDSEITSAPTPVSGTHNDFAVMMAVANSGDIAARNNVHGFRNGFDASSGLIANNYVHDLRMYSGAHSQPVYGWCDPGQMTLDHNTFISDGTNDGQNITYASGTVYIADDCQPQNNRTVTNNWLVGGSLTVYGGGNNSSNIVIKNNRFSTAQFPQCGWWGYGGAFVASNPGNVWSGNTWADGVNAGKTLAAP